MPVFVSKNYEENDGGTYVSVVVFAKDVENTAVERWLDVVELCNVGMLDRVDKHFASNDDEEWRQNFA